MTVPELSSFKLVRVRISEDMDSHVCSSDEGSLLCNKIEVAADAAPISLKDYLQAASAAELMRLLETNLRLSAFISNPSLKDHLCAAVMAKRGWISFRCAMSLEWSYACKLSQIIRATLCIFPLAKLCHTSPSILTFGWMLHKRVLQSCHCADVGHPLAP
jgi:hypothetical protein